METIAIKVEDHTLYLPDILAQNGYDGLIPTNVIINKRRPGLGATQGEIEASRHSIILEPFITVLETKKAKYNDLICVVYGDSSDDLIAYLNDTNIRYKKIITTPESFKRVLRSLKKYQPNYQQDYFMLIDESEKLIQSASFRERILEPMDGFFKFKNKAMISATPIIPSHDLFAANGFKLLDIVPTFDYQVPIKILATNNVNRTLHNIIKILSLERDNRPVLLFTNCKRAILYFTKLEGVKDDYKVFCADDLDTKFFKPNYVGNVRYTVKEQRYNRYNAFTSRFFAAVDMFLQQSPHIIILTNVPFVEHSAVDPATDVVQIWGRARKPFEPASITHITNFYNELKAPTTDELQRDTEKEIYFVQRLQELQRHTQTKSAATAILSFIDKEKVAITLNNDGTINPYMLDNYNLAKYLKSIYGFEHALLSAYQNSYFFIPKLRSVYHPFSDADELKIERSRSGKAKRKVIAERLHLLFDEFDYYYNEMGEYEYYRELQELMSHDNFIYRAYLELDFATLQRLKFSKLKIADAIFDKRKVDNTNHMLMIDKILTSFTLKIKTYSEDIKRILQAIYIEFNHEKKPGIIHTAKGADIERYFNCKLINGKQKDDNKSYYRLESARFKLAEDLKFIMD